MAEGGALREAGRARGVLDVDRLVGRERGLDRLDGAGFDIVGLGEQVVPTLMAHVDHVLELGQFGSDLVDHAHVVAGLEVGDGDEPAAPRLGQRVLHLMRAIRGIDVDLDHPDAGGGELDEDPFGDVRRPDADPVALHEPSGHQRTGEPIDLGPQLVVGVADALLPHDQRITPTVRLDRGSEIVADGHGEQGGLGGSDGVTEAGVDRVHGVMLVTPRRSGRSPWLPRAGLSVRVRVPGAEPPPDARSGFR